MTKTFSSKKSAFSLIELSIVLIVIGLLIAGITGGASLIKSSELRSVMGEARSYAVGVNAFYTQYNALPGDYATVIGNSYAGNGDSKIQYYNSATHGAALTGSESANAWVVLRTIGAIDGISSAVPLIATTSPTFGSTSAANAPSSKIKSSGWAFDYRTIEITDPQNVVVLTSTITTTGLNAATNTLVNGTNVATAAITPSDALSIDAKIDDNVPNTGKVRGLNTGNSTTCYTAPAYTTATTTKTCGLTYQVDVNS